VRSDKNNRNRIYRDYLDWVLDGWNAVWLFSLFFGYLYYLVTTEEI
jgi:hypothetical protein